MSTDPECPVCYQEPGTYETAGGRKFNEHDNLDGATCEMSNEPVPE